MRVYVSGTFTSQSRLRPCADALRKLGHDVVSTWLYEPAKPAHLNTDEWNEMLADKDIAEAFACDCLILDIDGESTTGGRYSEWGIVLYPGSMRRRYVVGGKGKTGVFLSKAHRRFDNWDELLAYFEVAHNALYQK